MAKAKQNNTTEYKSTVIGVDFGSSSAKIAAVDKGVVEVITNEANFRQTPTVVGYGDNERMIGQSGNGKIKSNYANTIVAPNRYLGFSNSRYIEKEGKFCPAGVKINDNALQFNVKCQGKSEVFIPEQVTAAFITKIEKIIAINKLDVKNMVITVPSYFSQHERQALFDSVMIANKSASNKYPVQIVNESTAIGYEYGFNKRNDFGEGKNVLFIDMGHSKLGASLINFTKKGMKVIYENYERQLGCKNFDEKILEFYIQMFENDHPNLQLKVSESKRATLKLLQNIEKQRKVLTGNSEYDFTIQCLLEDEDISYTMTRQQFQEITQPISNQIRLFFSELKETINAKNIPIDQIELIGGGSRMPIFIKIVTEEMMMPPARTVNSDECIAKGAAFAAVMNCPLFRTGGYDIQEVQAYGVSIKAKEIGEEIEEAEQEIQIIQKGEQSKKQFNSQISVSSKCKKVLITVQYNNIEEGVQSKIVSFSVNLPENKTENPTNLSICLKKNFNNMFTAITVSSSKNILKNENENWFVKLRKESIKEFENKQKQMMDKDEQIVLSYEKRNQFESFIYNTKEKLEQNEKINREFINPQSYTELMQVLVDFEGKISALLSFDAEMKEINTKFSSFVKQVEGSKAKYTAFEKQLSSLQQLLQGVVKGKIRGGRHCSEDAQKVQTWIDEVKKLQLSKGKWEEPAATIQQIKQTHKYLTSKLEQAQHREQMNQSWQSPSYQRLPRKQTQPQQPTRQSQPEPQYPSSPFGFSQTPNRGGYNTRQTRRDGFGGGFFNGFGGFY